MTSLEATPRPQSGHTHPSAGVTDQCDEKGPELGPADLRGRVVGHGQEALSTGFPHPPYTVRAGPKNLRGLPKQTEPCYSDSAILSKDGPDLVMPWRQSCKFRVQKREPDMSSKESV